MESEPGTPDDAVVRAVSIAWQAADLLREAGLADLDGVDAPAWRRSLEEARGAFGRLLAARNGAELEAPSRGQLDRFDEPRFVSHLRGLARALAADLERFDPGDPGRATTATLLGLLYSVRSAEHVARWAEDRRAPRVVAPPASVAAPEAPAAPAPARQPDATDAAVSVDFQPMSLPELEPASPEPPPPPPPAPELPRPAEPPLRLGDLVFEQTAVAEPLKDAPPPAPPEPAVRAEEAPNSARRQDVDLSTFFERPDEYSGALHLPTAALHHACSRGPKLSGRTRCLDATLVRRMVGGAAFALADGSDESIGSEVASVIATNTFCGALAALKVAPKDLLAALHAAAEAARERLDWMLRSILDSADESDAFRRLGGGLPSRTVRRTLRNTFIPDPSLGSVRPAFSVSFAGGAVVRREDDVYELTIVTSGAAVVERKPRNQPVEVLAGPEPASPPLGPGRQGWSPSSMTLLGPLELKPGDVVIVASPALRHGYEGTALDKLEAVCPEVLRLASPNDPHALGVLRQACAAADRFDALDGQKDHVQLRKRIFGDDLSIVILTVALRERPQARPPAEPAPAERRWPTGAISRLLKRDPK